MRILIIDDDRNSSHFLKLSLEAEHFAVDHAHDGTTGARLTCLNDYDLVVLDDSLPDVCPVAVCAEIRAYGKTMPILVISEDGCTRAVPLLDAGADDCIAKPFALMELVARMRALLRRPHTLMGETLAAQGLTLNIRTGVVTNGSKELLLTRKEFMLLEYFMRNQGAVLSRSMLIEHVWDMSIDLFSNTIESHVLSLRRKIGDARAKKVITTVSGRGYRFH